MTGTEFLERYAAGERDFHDADLHGADLRGADLSWADLRWSNLYGADLRWASLREADFDFSCLPMWCGSFDLVCDKRLVAQLLYHLSRLDVRDCPEWDELRHDPRLVALANQSHVITKHDLPEVGV